MTQFHHQLELLVGGSSAPVRSEALVVLPHDFQIRTEATGHTNTPASRAECPPNQGVNGGRLCPYVHCRHNLWHVAGEDRPGRRWKEGELPPPTAQLHFTVTGGRGPRVRDSEPSQNDIRMWTEDNCALDRLGRRKSVSDKLGIDWREPMTHREVAMSCGDLTDRQVRRIVRKALRKLGKDGLAKELRKLMVER